MLGKNACFELECKALFHHNMSETRGTLSSVSDLKTQLDYCKHCTTVPCCFICTYGLEHTGHEQHHGQQLIMCPEALIVIQPIRQWNVFIEYG